ncbi:MAG TPA: rhodanese-like domain-containing protein [Bdellovibrionales bacterium]|nr:rhodanese-like domain-containing protein [Bdellovibrionales bacterium]
MAALFAAACRTPTKVRETTTNLPTARDNEIAITEQTIVLDARPYFQYTSGHLPQAIPVRWEDFSRPGANNKAELDPDYFSLARRLSRLGISPDTPVVVLGNGAGGNGEEGRVAWVLALLGVKRVQFALDSHFEGKRMAGEPSPAKNAAIWKPHPVFDLLVSRKELLDSAKKMTTPGTEPVVILDVRAASDYLKKPANQIDLGSINIEWKNFLDERGRPRRAILRDLQAVGIDPGERIIVLSDDGVKSATVTMALRELGYPRAGNFSEGLNGLATQGRKRP